MPLVNTYSVQNHMSLSADKYALINGKTNAAMKANTLHYCVKHASEVSGQSSCHPRVQYVMQHQTQAFHSSQLCILSFPKNSS